LVEALGDICGWKAHDEQVTNANDLSMMLADEADLTHYIKKQTQTPRIFLTWLCKVDLETMIHVINDWGDSPDRIVLTQFLLHIIQTFLNQDNS
jgi:hypothetical protein